MQPEEAGQRSAFQTVAGGSAISGEAAREHQRHQRLCFGANAPDTPTPHPKIHPMPTGSPPAQMAQPSPGQSRRPSYT